MESGLGIKYGGGGEEGQESQFTSVYSLFFIQAVVLRIIFVQASRHSN